MPKNELKPSFPPNTGRFLKLWREHGQGNRSEDSYDLRMSVASRHLFFSPPSKWMIFFLLLFFVGKSAFCRPVPGYSYRKVERAEARLRRAPTHKAMVLKGLFMTICACKRLQGFCFLCVGTKYRNESPLLPNGPQTPSWSFAVKMSFPQTAPTR